VGDECATLVAIDPLLFIGQVSERSIANVTMSAKGIVSFVTGESQEAQISFVSESAEDATRTFRIEATVPNPDGSLRAGVTAVLNLPLEATPAHFVSGSVITLNDDGQVGVRIVDDTSTVRFMPVVIIGEEPNGLWLAGLPETINLITVGQDFVLDGQKVDAQLITAENGK
jgi:multidrug efflux system membrane fusion protein